MSTKQVTQENVIQKAWEDSEFKAQLLANPKAALKEAFGIDVPQGIEINIVEETSTNLYFVLPQNPTVAKKEDVEGAAWQ
ncbi:NHLP leader peptide family natural product precursor [Paenibacillus sp. FSL H8-0548]|nr:NHLP leader peptide family natural product precursor [Paenibacillus sp. FSL H8-0548]